MHFNQAAAIHGVVHALLNSPKGLSEETLYAQNGAAFPTQEDYHKFLATGIDQGALVSVNGKVNLSSDWRARAPSIDAATAFNAMMDDLGDEVDDLDGDQD